MALTTDVLYEIYGHVQDKTTIDSALEVVPDIVHKAVRRIHSPRVVEVPVSYLAAFKRLEHTTNILVRVEYQKLDTLHLLSHLRSLCVEVFGVEDHIYCIQQLEQIFGVADKRDDQFFVFKVQTPKIVWSVCYHNAHYIGLFPDILPPGFTAGSLYSLRPRCYYDLLQGIRPYVDDRLGRVLDIVLKHRYYGDVDLYFIRAIVQQLDERFGDFVDHYMRDFIEAARLCSKTGPDIAKTMIVGIRLPWQLLHYYDIPDRPPSLTEEEEEILRKL